jgi:hypothetical protein
MLHSVAATPAQLMLCGPRPAAPPGLQKYSGQAGQPSFQCEPGHSFGCDLRL